MMISSSLLIGGCSGDSGGGTTANNITENEIIPPNNPIGSKNLYSGDSNILGTISLSDLNGIDSNKLNKASTQQPKSVARSIQASPRAFTATTDNAIVKLYAVGSNGVLADTGIDCAFDSEKDEYNNPKYACNDIADGQNYVVKYVRILEGDKALEMKVNIDIPEGTTEVAAENVSPQSTVVADTIVNAILSATEGKKIDSAIIHDLIKTVKKAVDSLIKNGAIQIPSMVVEAPKNSSGEFITDVAVLNTDKDITFDINDMLESTSGTLLSDDSVSRELNAAKMDIEMQALTLIETDTIDGKRKLISQVFNNLLDGDDIPDFMLDFFTDRFAGGHTITASNLFAAVDSGLEFNQALDINHDSLNISAEDAAVKFKGLLAKTYALQTKKTAGNLSEEEQKELADIPAIIPVLFPSSEWSGTTITPDSTLDIPQSIVMTIYIIEKYVPDSFKAQIEGIDEKLNKLLSVTGENQASKEMEYKDPIDFNPMHFDESEENPGLMQVLGFFDPDYTRTLSDVEIAHLDVMPDKIWIEDTDTNTGGKEYDSLHAHVCVNDLSLIAAQSGSETRDLSVELSYPTNSGDRAFKALENEADLYSDQVNSTSETTSPEPNQHNEGGFENCFTLNPWASTKIQSIGSDTGDLQPSLENVVSDFKSGEYKVTVKDATGGVLAEKAFQKKVIAGMQHAAPQLTSPLSVPQWPVECKFSKECPQWDELNSEWVEKGGNTTFALNTDSNADSISDKAKVSINWGKPTIDLPQGVKIAYSLNVAMNSENNDSGYSWKSIYSTHEHDKRLFGNSFTLPTPLEKLESQDGNYSVNVCAEFIDTENGEYLGSGGCGFADFNVGEPLNLEATFDITGKAPMGLSDNWKVALISENFNYSTSESTRDTKTISDIDEEGNYSLSPTIGAFLQSSASTYFTIVLFQDENEDGQLLITKEGHEEHFWPNWESSIWFDTWSGRLRAVSESYIEGKGTYDHQEVVITGGETIEGPDFIYLSTEGWSPSQGISPPTDVPGF